MRNKILGKYNVFKPIINHAKSSRKLENFSVNIQDQFNKQTSNLKTFFITHLKFKTKVKRKMLVQQNEQCKATLYRKFFDSASHKIKKSPVEIGIAESKNKWAMTYHFIEPDTNREIGYVTICDWQIAKKYIQMIPLRFAEGKLLKDYPEFGVTGKRITIDYLQNNLPDEYAGIGKAADQIAVEYCLKTGIKPVITSIADMNSHAAHYLRGRRFFPSKSLISRFGTDNPNELIRERILKTPQGQKVECSDLGPIYMYMPEKIIQRYMKKIEKHKILQ